MCGILCLLLMSACSKNDEGDEALEMYRGMSEQRLYNDSIAAMKEKDYASAIKRFDAFDTLFPFSNHSRSAQLYLIYAYFKNSDFALSAASSERYIHLYPRDPNVDYAYYMRGVANFEQQRGTFAKVFKLDDSWRDPGTQLASYYDFLELTKRFPKSRFYSDSLKRIIYLRNQFAKKELHIANFYMKRKRYVAALERARYVVKHYGQSPQAQKALVLSKKINTLLQLNRAAKDDQRVINDTYEKV